MPVRWWLVTAFALGVVPSATPSTVASALRPIPVPTSGNVSIARLTIVAKAGQQAPSPRLRLTSRGPLPPEMFVVGGVTRDPITRGRFSGTIALFNASSSAEPGTSAPATVDVRLPPGYLLTGRDVVANVLYQNDPPTASVVVPSSVSVLAGAPAPKIAPRRLLVDARKLAFDVTVPIADMELLGLDYISAAFARAGGSRTSFTVTIAIAKMSQINALQLTFPAGVTVVSGTGPPLAGVAPSGRTVQVTASTGFFNEATPYRFELHLDRAPPNGGSITLQASTHYFESVLPFTERFYVPA